MLGGVLIAGSIVLVGIFVRYYSKREDLPPKAQTVCDAWKTVESFGKQEGIDFQSVS